MFRRPRRSTRTYTLFPCTTLFRSQFVPGARVRCYGTPRAGQQGLEIVHPSYRVLGDGEDALDERLAPVRSEEHTSELQSLMRISYAVFCLKKKNIQK